MQIKSWIDSTVLFKDSEPSVETGSDRDIGLVERALKVSPHLNGADLAGWKLRGLRAQAATFKEAMLDRAWLNMALLDGATFCEASLWDTELLGASLYDCNFVGANLKEANLHGADIRQAQFRGADLSGANLCDTQFQGCNIRGAKLSESTRLPNGQMFHDYNRFTVPALLTARGKTLQEILDTGCWECHEWSNCPLHEAWGIDDEKQAPLLLQPFVKQFLWLFDAELLPEPELEIHAGAP